MKQALLALVALTALAAPASAQAQSSFSAEEVRALLHSKVVQDRRSLGMVVGVVDDSGQAFYAVGQACAAGGPALDENAVFEVGSLTKPFTVSVMNALAAAGALRPDAPVSDHLGRLGVSDPAGLAGVSYQHLADHTAGLPMMPDNLTDVRTYDRADMARFLSSFRADRAPGSQRSYSNLGVGLLGLLMSAQENRPFSELVEQRIAQPLGLHNTGFDAPAERRVCGHDESLTPVPSTALGEVMQPAGGLLSTPRDMMTFLKASMGMDVAITPRWGRLQDVRGRALVGHDGSTPGFASYLAYDPERRRGVLVMSNSRFLVNDVALHLLQPDYPLVPRRVPIALSEAEAARHEGEFADGDLSITVAKHGARLFLVRPREPLRELFAEGPNRFFVDDSRPAHFSGSDLLLFQRDGNAQRLQRRGAAGVAFEQITPETFDVSAGDYRLAPDKTLQLRRRGDRFYAQITGQDELEILPVQSRLYRYIAVDAQIRVENGGQRVVILQGGEETPAERQ